MKDISYQELANCQDYAERVVKLYKKCNNGNLPQTATDAENAVREYNHDFRKFKTLYGYSIRGYINNIVECIGFMVENEKSEEPAPLRVCERCLMAIESREGSQVTRKIYVDEDSPQKCDWCETDDNDILYEIL